MICPHCHRTIREEQRYLMSRDPDARYPPAWLATAVLCLIVFFAVYAAIAAIHS